MNSLYKVDAVFDNGHFTDTNTFLKVGVNESQVEEAAFKYLRCNPKYFNLLGITIEKIENVDGYEIVIK